MQGHLDGPAYKYFLNFLTANVCAVTVKSDFILPLPKNTCACTFTSFFSPSPEYIYTFLH